MDTPKEVNVDHPSLITVGNNILEITTTFASGGEPAGNAEVIITSDNIFVTASADTLGKVYIEIEPAEVEILTITVRGRDVYPYQGEIRCYSTW